MFNSLNPDAQVAQRSLLPWRVSHVGRNVHILDADGESVALVNDDDAQPIVRAVNNIDALMEALRKVCGTAHTSNPDIIAARALLAKLDAEGK